MQSMTLPQKYTMHPMDGSFQPGGGDGPPIVVVGNPGGGSVGGGATGGDGGVGTGAGGSSGGGGLNSSNNGGRGYETAGRTDAANRFADAHIDNVRDTASGYLEYNKVHDALANAFDYAQVHPNDLVNIGGNTLITMSQALADVNRGLVIITDSYDLTGANGAQNNVIDGQIIIGINPDSTNMQNYQNRFGDAGVNYAIFHEYGHELNYYSDPMHFDSQSYANTAGHSLENLLGYQQLPVMPGDGYG